MLFRNILILDLHELMNVDVNVTFCIDIQESLGQNLSLLKTKSWFLQKPLIFSIDYSDTIIKKG
jgi:hypothetical protein